MVGFFDLRRLLQPIAHPGDPKVQRHLSEACQRHLAICARHLGQAPSVAPLMDDVSQLKVDQEKIAEALRSSALSLDMEMAAHAVLQITISLNEALEMRFASRDGPPRLMRSDEHLRELNARIVAIQASLGC